MSLTGALQIGKSGLLVSQSALEVAGNNLANAATRGYHRQSVELATLPSQQIEAGVFAGRGVQIQSITRQINEALESRLRDAGGQEASSAMLTNLLGQVEAIENEFSDIDLSTRLGAYFNAWSELANNPQDLSLRTLLSQEASSLAQYIQGMDSEFKRLVLQTDQNTEQSVAAVNDLLDRIGELNQRIVSSEGGSGGANGLRDQRDVLLSDLSKYLDVSMNESASGSLDIFVGSLPIMLNGQSRGVELKRESIDNELHTSVVVAADGSELNIASGEIGALVRFRQQDLQDAIQSLNDFTHALIWETNRLHSQGQGLGGYGQVTGLNRALDSTAALNDAAAALTFAPQHGSFEIHLTQTSTGQRETSTIFVDLDGLGGNDTTLDALAADLDAVSNLTATVTADGRLQLSADSGDYEISFSNDSSGALAALGIHTFFTGTDAFDVSLNERMLDEPSLIAAAQGHAPGDNRNALALAGLRDQGVASLGDMSLSGYWNRHVEDFAVRLSQARSQQEADAVVKQNLEAQQQPISGVNTDEEAIDLITYQRAYQANARFLSVVDEMLQTLMSLV